MRRVLFQDGNDVTSYANMRGYHRRRQSRLQTSPSTAEIVYEGIFFVGSQRSMNIPAYIQYKQNRIKSDLVNVGGRPYTADFIRVLHSFDIGDRQS